MASLKIVSDRTDDNALKFAVVLPPRRNGEVNFGAAEAINRALLTINPDAYDPQEVPAEQIALADGHTADGGGVIPHSLAMEALRDGAIPPDDDEGEPIPGFRCANGACVGD
jgi:hypothetical protein